MQEEAIWSPMTKKCTITVQTSGQTPLQFPIHWLDSHLTHQFLDCMMDCEPASLFHFIYVCPLGSGTNWGILDPVGTYWGQNIRFVPQMSPSMTAVHCGAVPLCLSAPQQAGRGPLFVRSTTGFDPEYSEPAGQALGLRSFDEKTLGLRFTFHFRPESLVAVPTRAAFRINPSHVFTPIAVRVQLALLLGVAILNYPSLEPIASVDAIPLEARGDVESVRDGGVGTPRLAWHRGLGLDLEKRRETSEAFLQEKKLINKQTNKQTKNKTWSGSNPRIK